MGVCLCFFLMHLFLLLVWRGACPSDNIINMTFLCEQAQGTDESEGRYELKPDMSLVHHSQHC